MNMRIVFIIGLVVLLAGCGTIPSAGAPTQVPQQSATVGPAQPTKAPAPTQVHAQPTKAPAPTVAPAAPTQAPAPTAAPAPTVAPAPPTSTVPRRLIVIDTPVSGVTVTSPLRVSGRVTVSPFEATLTYSVYDANGKLIGRGPIMVQAEMGQPGGFDGPITFNAPAGGSGRVEIAELSPKDGAPLVTASVDVTFAASAPGGLIEIPAAGAQTTLPLHVLARVGKPGEQVQLVLRWQDGTELRQNVTLIQGEDRPGLAITNLDWNSESQPPQPGSQPATLELRDVSGGLLAQQSFSVLASGDPNTRTVKLYWLLGEQLQEIMRTIVQTPRIGTVALEELLWGPTPGNLAGFSTALPTPEEVLRYPGRTPDWGPRVRLLKLTIVDGVATADFSKELMAYGGGSARVQQIVEQITRTLTQFPTVREVKILVEGQAEMLQP